MEMEEYKRNRTKRVEKMKETVERKKKREEKRQ
jgi:hypothetical protein